jgi:glyoxylase-like metal-dependent hydrolase (beta-lactamase superfamily II)
MALEKLGEANPTSLARGVNDIKEPEGDFRMLEKQARFAVTTLLSSLTLAVLFGVGAPRLLQAQTAEPKEQTAEPKELVKQAVDAMGGADALRNLRTIKIDGTVEDWEPEQSYVAGGEPRYLGKSDFVVTWDLKDGRARTDWDRVFEYFMPFFTHEVYSEVVTPQFGFAEAGNKGPVPLSGTDRSLMPKGQTAMAAIRVAADLRELERSSPLLLLKALDAPQNLKAMPDQVLGGGTFGGGFGGLYPAVSLPAITFVDGPTIFTILFDRTTHLPAAIRTVDDDPILGDSNYDMVLSSWQPVGGVKMARAMTYTLNNIRISKQTYTNVAANPAIDAAAFAIPDAIKTSAKPPASDTVPYQWVLRRQNFNAFLNSDSVNFPAGGGLKLVELAPNVQQIVGGSHNSLIVAMKDYLVVFDAPINEWQSLFTISAAKAKYPGKPIKYLVLTHHHNDHTGGSRAYVAEGAAVIVPSPDKAFFEQVFSAPHTVVPDELAKNPKPATVIEVADQMNLRDDSEQIRLFNIANPHVDGMLIGYVMNADVLWVTDIYSPVRDKEKTPAATTFYQTLKQLGLKPARLAGGHGGASSYADLETLMK